ncbi:MAG: CoA transferase, partial [Pedococcus sp.]
MNPLLRQVLPALGLDEGYAAAHLDLLPGSALPSVLPVNTLACGSVAAAGLAGLALHDGRGQGGPGADDRVHVDPRQVSVAFRSDQVLTVDGVRENGFAPLSGFFPTHDGWVRTHANYPHHRERLLRALDLPGTAGRDETAAAIAERSAQDVEDAVTADHGIAVRVRRLGEWMAEDQAHAVATHDVLAVRSVGDTGGMPVPERPRVLDLTRVIAGP